MFVKLNGLICAKCLKQCLKYYKCYISFPKRSRFHPQEVPSLVWITFFPAPSVTRVVEMTMEAEEDLSCSSKPFP